MQTHTTPTTIFGRTLVWCTVFASSLVAGAVDPGDMFADRPAIGGPSGTITGTTVDATREDGEPMHAGLTGTGTVWRSWTAPETGLAVINTFGSVIDTLVAVYTGDSLETLVEVASNDDIDWPTNLLSEVTFTTKKNVTYAIVVEGFKAQGNYSLNWSLTPTHYELTVNSIGYGKVRIYGITYSLPYTGTFPKSHFLTMDAIPLGGWKLKEWNGTFIYPFHTVPVTMTENITWTATFTVDDALNVLNIPWYVDNAGVAQGIPPKDGKTCTLVFLNNTTDAPLNCFIEYYTQDGTFIGPFEDNAFTVAAGASVAFRPVADDPAASGGQEAEAGLAVPNRPRNTENGNDGKANGSIVIRYPGDPSDLTGQVQSYSTGGGMGAYATSYTLPPGVTGTGGLTGVCVTSVPWYVDNAGVAQGIPPKDGGRMTLVFLHNNRNTDITCFAEYFTQDGVSIGPDTGNSFVIPANASIAFRPVADDPASVPGGQEGDLGLAVPNRPLGTENGNDNKKNGSIRITWLGQPNDIQGVVTSYSNTLTDGPYASSNLLPPGRFKPLFD